MVAKKLFLKGVNLGKIVTLSLYITTRSGNSIHDDQTYTVAMPPTPWNTVTIQPKAQYEEELTWTGRLGFFDPETDPMAAHSKFKYIPDREAQLVNSVTGVQYHSVHLLSYAFAEPQISSRLLQAVDKKNENPGVPISLKLIEESGTAQPVMHPIFTFKSTEDGLSVHGNPARRILSIHVSPDHQEAALAKPNGGPIGMPIGKFDMLGLDPNASILIQYNATTDVFTASLDSSTATTRSAPDTDANLKLPDKDTKKDHIQETEEDSQNQGLKVQNE